MRHLLVEIKHLPNLLAGENPGEYCLSCLVALVSTEESSLKSVGSNPV